MNFKKLKKEASKPTKIEEAPKTVKANTEIIAEEDNNTSITLENTIIKKETLEEIILKLQTHFMLGQVYLFLDLDINKYVIINYNSSDKFDTLKSFDKQSITHLIKSMLTTRINSQEVVPFSFSRETMNNLISSVQGVKKSFDRSREEFFTDTDYLPTLNLFKRTPLIEYEPVNRLTFEELESTLRTKYKRLDLLLRNNIGSYKNIEWFLNWVSMEINQPKDIKTTFIVIGEQGSGKTILIEEIFKENLYHFSNVSVLDNKTIKDNFNDIYNYKSFIIMNEVSTMDLKENNQIAQDLKRLITDGSYINRGMFKSGIEKNKTFNLGFTTNKNVPVQIESGDRRFSVFGRGKKLLELEELKKLNKVFNEDFDGFIINVRKEIREFLFLVKSLNYNKNVAIDPITTDLKKKIIEQSNKKEDLMKSYFNTKNYKELEGLLKGFEFDNEEIFFKKIKDMFEVGIFSNDILFLIYVAVYEVDINEYNRKSESKKSGAFWSKILHKPNKPQLKVNGVPINFKVFDEKELEDKKMKLRRILNGQDIDEIEIPF